MSAFALAAASALSARASAAFALAAPLSTATTSPSLTKLPLRMLSVSTMACDPPRDGAASAAMRAPGTIFPTHATAEPPAVSAAERAAESPRHIRQKKFFIGEQITPANAHYNTKNPRAKFACPPRRKAG